MTPQVRGQDLEGIQGADVSIHDNRGTACFEHLTGHSRGNTAWLVGDRLSVTLSPTHKLHISPEPDAISSAGEIAQLVRTSDTFLVIASETAPIWVNGRRRERAELRHGDMVEFGERGPLCRYCLLLEKDFLHRSVGDVCFMDSLSMILLTIPIFFPIVSGLDFGLSPEDFALWFGILVLIVVEVGLITPPVGMNLFIINFMADGVPMGQTCRGAIPFILTDIVRVGVLVAFPILTLGLVWAL